VFCFIQILSQNTIMEDNQDNLACTPLEICEVMAVMTSQIICLLENQNGGKLQKICLTQALFSFL
jgi:hypothetical protein